jgi:hypothetical protein
MVKVEVKIENLSLLFPLRIKLSIHVVAKPLLLSIKCPSIK